MEDAPVEEEGSSKYSFHHRSMFLVKVSRTPATLYTVWVEHHIPVLSCLTVARISSKQFGLFMLLTK